MPNLFGLAVASGSASERNPHVPPNHGLLCLPPLSLVAGPLFTWIAPVATPVLRAGGRGAGRVEARLRLTAGEARSARGLSKLPPDEAV